MVKADVRRDYYADLGLTPSADGEDIKKQFRKLALKYHPDRNPGREVEFNAKFQAIQAAHEILSDPQQRLKYDTDRLRAGYGKLYGPSRANNSARRPPTASYPPSPAAAATTAAKPQPPKPPFPNRPSSFQNGTAAGAQRYASYARAAPQRAWQKAQDNAQTRADAYRGFQEMKNSGAKPPGWSTFDPQTGRSSYQPNSSRPAPSATGSPGQPARPKSAYEYFKSAGTPTPPEQPTRSQSTRKKQGFAPGTAAGGDEPMARSTSSYASVPRAERTQSAGQFYVAVPPPTATKTAPGATFAAQPERPTVPELERTSSRYAQASGEKTFFSSAWLGRSTSVRDSTGGSRSHSRTIPPSPSSPPSGRHRSASPDYHADRHYQYFSTSTSSSEPDDEDELVFKPKAVPESRLRSHPNFTNLHAQHEWTSASSEHPRTTQSDADRPPPPLPRRPGSFGARRPPPPGSYAAASSDTTDSDYFQGHGSDTAAFAREARPFATATDSGPDENHTPADRPRGSYPTSKPTETSKSASEEHLRKKFSVEDWHDTFQFFGGNFSASSNAQRGKPSNVRGRSAARPNSSWKSKSATTSSDDASQPAAQKQQHPPPSFPDAPFSVDSWVEQLRNVSFDARPAEGQQQPPRNPPSSRNAKKPARPAVRVRPVPQPASVATEAEETHATVDELTDTSSDGEAMDIDDELPPTQPNNGAAQPPGRPPTATGPTSGRIPHDGADIAAEANGANADATEQALNMNKLSNVTPFTSTNAAGIDNLQDISSTLPFDSRPHLPTSHSRPIRPRDLHCPNPPKRPRAPEPVPAGPGSQQRVLPRSTWQRYVAEMNTYMREWKDFNRRMLAHFNARQDAIETGLAPNWIDAVGDSPTLKIPTDGDGDGGGNGNNADDSGLADGLGDGSSRTRDPNNERSDDTNANPDDILIPGSAKGGYSAYLRGLEEDVKVREHWNVACELHRDCILELGRLRDWIRNGGRVV